MIDHLFKKTYNEFSLSVLHSSAHKAKMSGLTIDTVARDAVALALSFGGSDAKQGTVTIDGKTIPFTSPRAADGRLRTVRMGTPHPAVAAMRVTPSGASSAGGGGAFSLRSPAPTPAHSCTCTGGPFPAGPHHYHCGLWTAAGGERPYEGPWPAPARPVMCTCIGGPVRSGPHDFHCEMATPSAAECAYQAGKSARKDSWTC